MSSPKVIILTGASRGIGLAIAHYLLKQSHKLLVVARSAGPLEALEKEYPGQVKALAADLSDFSVCCFFVLLMACYLVALTVKLDHVLHLVVHVSTFNIINLKPNYSHYKSVLTAVLGGREGRQTRNRHFLTHRWPRY